MCLPFHIFYNCVTSWLLFRVAAHAPPSLFSTANLWTLQIKGAACQVKYHAITNQKILDIFIVLSPKNGT